MNRLQFIIGAVVMLVAMPTYAHVVGVKLALPSAPGYERILEEPVTLYHAMEQWRAIQAARDLRTGTTSEVLIHTTRSAFRQLGRNYCLARGERRKTRDGRLIGGCLRHGNSVQNQRNERTGAVYVPAHADRSIAAIQQRRAQRTEHLRVIQKVEQNLFRPVLWGVPSVELRARTLRSSLRNLQFINDDRADRTGIPRQTIVKRTFSELQRDVQHARKRGCRPHRKKKADVPVTIKRGR